MSAALTTDRTGGVLSASSVANIAKAHGIHVREKAGVVELLEWVSNGEEMVEQWVDTSDWSIRDLMAWLGY